MLDQRSAKENLILKYKHRLQKFEEQRALQGISTGPTVLLEIEDIEVKMVTQMALPQFALDIYEQLGGGKATHVVLDADGKSFLHLCATCAAAFEMGQESFDLVVIPVEALKLKTEDNPKE